MEGGGESRKGHFPPPSLHMLLILLLQSVSHVSASVMDQKAVWTQSGAALAETPCVNLGITQYSTSTSRSCNTIASKAECTEAAVALGLANKQGAPYGNAVLENYVLGTVGCYIDTDANRLYYNTNPSGYDCAAKPNTRQCLCLEDPNVVNAGFSLQTASQAYLPANTCLSDNAQACGLGLRGCSAGQASCEILGDSNIVKFRWQACQLASLLPPSMETVTATGGSGPITASCPSGKRIAFGFSVQTSTSAPEGSLGGACLKRNSKPCVVGDSSCGTELCDTDGDDMQFVYLLCAAPADLAWSMQKAAGDREAITASCPSGSQIAFGFKMAWADTILIGDANNVTACLSANSGACSSGIMCSTNNITERGCGLLDQGLPPTNFEQRVYLACLAPPCPAQGPPVNGTTQCSAAMVNGEYKDGTICTHACDSGYRLAGATAGGGPLAVTSTCQAGLWDTPLPACVNVNECLELPQACFPPTNCTDTLGDYQCSMCPSGFEQTSDGKTQCLDVLECPADAGNNPDPAGVCGPQSECTELVGSFACAPVLVSATGSAGVVGVGGNAFQAIDTKGGGRLALTVKFPSAVDVVDRLTFGYVGMDPATVFDCDLSTSLPSALTAVQAGDTVVLECTLPPAGGKSLVFTLHTRRTLLYDPLYAGDKGFASASLLGGFAGLTLSHPAPVFTPLGISPSSSPAGVQASVLIQGNFFPPAAYLAVGLGPAAFTLLFKCTPVDAQCTDSQIVCLTPEQGTASRAGEELFFGIVSLPDATGIVASAGGHKVEDSSMPFVFTTQVNQPSVSSVTGCPTDTSSGTMDCPTEGAVEVTISGANFLPPTRVTIDGRQCTPTFSNSTVYQCLLPSGAGVGKAVVVQSQDRFSPPAPLVSYALPFVQVIEGCQAGGGGGPTGCKREGGDIVTLRGSNFGAFGARVLVGQQQCFNSTHAASTPHAKLTCTLPKGSQLGVSLRVLQRNGELSEAVLVSYAQCQAGAFSESPLPGAPCLPCPPGSASSSPSATQCLRCSVGSVAPAAGASKCDLCPPGHFFGIQQQTLLEEALATVGQAGNQSEAQAAVAAAGSCVPCTPGRFTPSSGSSDCEDCPVKSFVATPAAQRCDACPKGRFGPSPAQAQCVACPVNKVADATGMFACAACPSGLVPGANATECSACPSGTYATAGDANAAAKCVACQTGFSQPNEGSSSCLPCEPGTYSGGGGRAVECEVCEKGYFQSAFRASECLGCTPGKFGQKQGMSRCEVCEKGSFSGALAERCELCDIGRFQAANEASNCEECEEGTFSGLGSTQCANCPTGEVATRGSSGCSKCPLDAQPDATQENCVCGSGSFAKPPPSPPPSPSSSSSSPSSSSSTTTCEQCPEGAACLGRGVTLRSIEAQPGYWRRGIAANASDAFLLQELSFYKCVRFGDCLGGSKSDCAAFREGPLCATCKPGYKADTLSAECEPCPETSASVAVTVLLVLLMCFALTLMFLVVLRGDRARIMAQEAGIAPPSQAGFAVRRVLKRMSTFHDTSAGNIGGNRKPSLFPASFGTSPMASSPNRDNRFLSTASDMPDPRFAIANSANSNSSGGSSDINLSVLSGIDLSGSRGKESHALTAASATAHLNLAFPLKAVVTFFQILTNLTALVTLPFPEAFRSFIQAFDFINIDFIPWNSLSCSLEGFDFYTKLIVTALVPVFVFALVFAAFFGYSKIADRLDMSDDNYNRHKRKLRVSQFYKLACFILFLVYPLLSSTIFSFFDCREVYGVSYIVQDFRVECGDAAWQAHSWLAVLMIIVYPVGIPLFFFAMMYKRRPQLYKDLHVRIAFGFLYEAYSRGLWWVELLDMQHKLILTSLVRFLGTSYQLPVAMLITFSYSSFILLKAPYVRKSDDRLMMLVLGVVFLMLQASYTLQSGAQGGGTVDDFTDGVLSAVLICLTVGVAVFTALQMVVFIRKMIRIRQRNKVEKKASRSCSIDSIGSIGQYDTASLSPMDPRLKQGKHKRAPSFVPLRGSISPEEPEEPDAASESVSVATSALATPRKRQQAQGENIEEGSESELPLV